MNNSNCSCGCWNGCASYTRWCNYLVNITEPTEQKVVTGATGKIGPTGPRCNGQTSNSEKVLHGWETMYESTDGISVGKDGRVSIEKSGVYHIYTTIELVPTTLNLVDSNNNEDLLVLNFLDKSNNLYSIKGKFIEISTNKKMVLILSLITYLPEGNMIFTINNDSNIFNEPLKINSDLQVLRISDKL